MVSNDSFLRVSAAYLFSCAYRDSLRAAFARHAAGNPVMAHGLHYRELLVSEAVSLMRTDWEDAAVLAARVPDHEIARTRT